MNHSIKKIICFLLFLTVYPVSIHAVSLIPIGQPEYNFLYKTFERQETELADSFEYQLAPYNNSDLKFELSALEFLHPKQTDKFNLFFFAGENFSVCENNRSTAFEKIRGGLTVTPYHNIYVYSSFSLDEQKAEDDNYHGKKWRGLAGGVDQSFLFFHSKQIDITAGRFKSFWGIKKSLVLSGANALDGLEYTLKYRKLALSYRIAKLNQLNNDLDNSIFENRYFAGHRLDIHINSKLRIGLFETLVFGGVGRTIEFNYLNPILFYHSDQLNDDINDNTYLGLDFTFYPKNKMKLYGQLFVDDFQIEKKSQGDREPNQYGLIIGSYLTNVVPSFDIRAEYIKVSNRTYNQVFDRNRYLFNNHSIGYFDKNDFDEIRFELFKWISAFSGVGLNYSFTRQGEGRITDEWSEPWLDTDGDYKEPFPSGVVEKTQQLSGQIQGFFFKHFYLDAQAGWNSSKNFNHINQNERSILFLQLNLSTFVSVTK